MTHITTQQLLDFVQQRLDSQHRSATRFAEKAQRDIRGPAALAHIACIDQAAQQMQELYKLSALAEFAGDSAVAKRIDRMVDRAWDQTMRTAHELRFASMGLPPPQRALPVPDVIDSDFGAFEAAQAGAVA